MSLAAVMFVSRPKIGTPVSLATHLQFVILNNIVFVALAFFIIFVMLFVKLDLDDEEYGDVIACGKTGILDKIIHTLGAM